MEAKEDIPGFKNALPIDKKLKAKKTINKLLDKDIITNPINNEIDPKIAIFFSATFPDILRITPP